MEDGLVPQIEAALNKSVNIVLILVVMEDGLVRYVRDWVN